MNWLILMAAGLFEVVWATALKMSNGFANVKAETFRPAPSLLASRRRLSGNAEALVLYGETSCHNTRNDKKGTMS